MPQFHDRSGITFQTGRGNQNPRISSFDTSSRAPILTRNHDVGYLTFFLDTTRLSTHCCKSRHFPLTKRNAEQKPHDPDRLSRPADSHPPQMSSSTSPSQIPGRKSPPYEFNPLLHSQADLCAANRLATKSSCSDCIICRSLGGIVLMTPLGEPFIRESQQCFDV